VKHSWFLVTISLLYNCVGPPDPDDGLIDNLPFVINTAEVFTFALRGNSYDVDESYDLSFALDSNAVLSTTLVVNEYSASDSTLIYLNNSADSTLLGYLILGNIVYTRSDTMSGNELGYPGKINVVGTNFNGVVDFQIIKK
tara:strand:+ start:39 stop:461 length:423 start_codon:yes stop_codon:yes gene_type:complete